MRKQTRVYYTNLSSGWDTKLSKNYTIGQKGQLFGRL